MRRLTLSILIAFLAGIVVGSTVRAGLEATELPAVVVPASSLAPTAAQAFPVLEGGWNAPAEMPKPATPSPKKPAVVKVAARKPLSPRPASSLSGIASWYCCTAGYGDGLYAAAGPALRSAIGSGWRGRSVTVSANGVLITVKLVDWCACGSGPAIDLESAAFRLLAPLARGLVEVTVRW